MELPDPVLSANVYCAGRLDELMQHGVVPFWRDLGTRGLEHRSYLWVLRYGRRGEHLKLRIHGSESCRSLLQDLLARAIDDYFSSTKESLVRPSVPEKGEAPPIDLEDEDPARADDRTLLWTTYRRSPISLGSRAMLADDQYVGRLTRALACGLESAIDIFSSEAGSPQSLRRNTLLKMLIAALAVTEFRASQRLNYLVYHRDWLLRVAMVTIGIDLAGSGKLLDDLDRQVEKVGPGIEIIRQAVYREWNNAGESSTSYLSWRRSIEDLCLCIGLYRESPDLEPDPFAEDLVFLPLFKVIHGLANQMGLRRLEEAFSIHLLLRAAGGDSPERKVRFIPA